MAALWGTEATGGRETHGDTTNRGTERSGSWGVQTGDTGGGAGGGRARRNPCSAGMGVEGLESWSGPVLRAVRCPAGTA